MIKHTVYDHPHSPPVKLFHKFCKKRVAGCKIFRRCAAESVTGRILIRYSSLGNSLSSITDNHAKVRINMLIILAVILVIRWGHKKWIEINHLNPQILQIIQLIPDTLQISSVKFSHIHCLRAGIPVFHLLHRTSNINIFVIRHIIVRISIAEAVNVNLIHNRTLGPLRRMKARSNAEGMTSFGIRIRSQSVIKADLTILFCLKIIIKGVLPCCYLNFIIIKQRIG